MARHCRFPSLCSWLWIVVLLTLCNLALSQTAFAQSVQSAPSQSPQTPVSSGSILQSPASPQPTAAKTFLVAPALAVSGAPSSVAAGDLNGDGKLDLVIASFDAGKISVLSGQGNG